MNPSRKLIVFSLALTAAGCALEVENPIKFLPVTGVVTYRGVPLEKGAINFTPFSADGTPAAGEIVGGSIREVTTRTRGDGVRPGRYRVAISGQDKVTQDYFKERQEKKIYTPNGKMVRDLVRNARSVIPHRYSNALQSGLVVELSPGAPTHFEFHLEDDETDREVSTASPVAPSLSP